MYLVVVISLDGYYVGSLQSLRALFNREFNFLIFLKAAVAVHLDGRVVDKHIIAIFASEKAVAFRRVEPFYGSNNSLTHVFSISISYNLVSTAIPTWGLRQGPTACNGRKIIIFAMLCQGEIWSCGAGQGGQGQDDHAQEQVQAQ